MEDEGVGSRIGPVVGAALLVFAAIMGRGAEAVRVYPYPMDPRLHPDDARRAVKPPDRVTFKNRMQFMALRSMGSNYQADLDRYTRQDRLGDIVWATGWAWTTANRTAAMSAATPDRWCPAARRARSST